MRYYGWVLGIVGLLGGCGASEVEPTKAASVNPAALSAAQQKQVLELQMQQMLMLQALQMQQQVYTTQMQTLQQHNEHVLNQMETFSATQACYMADNCRVETVIVPKP